MKSKMRILAMAAVLAVAAGAAVPAAAQEWVEISDAAGLRAVADNPAGHYRLTADIDLRGASFHLGTFTGTFDGNGHAIRNILCENSGFFSKLAGATVRNLSLRGGKVKSSYEYLGGLASKVSGETLIEDCTVDVEVGGGTTYAAAFAGYVDDNASLTLRRCRSLSAITSAEYAGGLVAYAWTSVTLSIEGCYVAGSVKGGTAGGLCGYVDNDSTTTCSISGSYWCCDLFGHFRTDDGMVGEYGEGTTVTDTPAILDGFPKNTFNIRTRGTGSGSAAFVDGEFVATPDADSVFVGWEGLPPEEGDYNETTVWAVFGLPVADYDDFRKMDLGGLYVQTADIDLAAVTNFSGFDNRGFRGWYDGGNHEIRNAHVHGGSYSGRLLGLFPATDGGAVIRNLRVVDALVEGSSGLGAVAGRAQKTTFSNVRVEGGSVTGTDGPVGGFAGTVYTCLFEDCMSAAEVTGSGDVGGFAGEFSRRSTARRCYAAGNVTSTSTNAIAGGAGGFFCETEDNTSAIAFEDCFALGNVYAESGSAGGFFKATTGVTPCSLANCFAAGAVSVGNGTAGGFNAVAHSNNTFTACCWDTEATGQATTASEGPVGLTTAEMQSGEPFEGWDTAVWNFTEGLYPRLRAFLPHYTVRWLGEDGETLLEEDIVDEGDTPVFGGGVPVKPEDTYNTYPFSGWTPEVVPAAADADYAATFATVPKWTGSGTAADPYVLLGPERIAEIIALDGGATAEMYVKTGGNVTEAALGAALPTGYAVRESGTAGVVKVVQVVTVVWYDEDGRTVLERDEDVAIGSTPSYDGAVPTKPATAQYTYEFAGWTPEPVAVTGSAAYTATYAETLRSYAITWRNADGSLLGTDTVAYGTVPEHAAPASVYNFLGWTPEVVAVTGEATYTATFGHQVVLDNLVADYTAAEGDELVGSSSHTVTIPGGITVTFNGTPVTGTGGGEPPAPVAPVFANGGASIATDFAAEGANKWTVEAVGVLEAGTAEGVTPAMVKVYAADTVAGLSTATPLATGVTLENRMNAVLVTLEVEPESTAEQQFFKVKFGD